MHPKDAEGIANSIDPDRRSLIWVCTVYQDLSIRKLRIITIFRTINFDIYFTQIPTLCLSRGDKGKRWMLSVTAWSSPHVCPFAS